MLAAGVHAGRCSGLRPSPHLTLDWDAFAYAGDPDQQLVLRSAEPGSSSHDKLRTLSSWKASVTAPAESAWDR
jgi:hypothetical protein